MAGGLHGVHGLPFGFRLLLQSLLDFLYPPLCLSCGCLLPEGGSVLCPRCHGLAPRLADADEALSRARANLRNESAVEDLAALWSFEGPVRDLIHGIKYDGLWSIAEEAGRWLGENLERSPERWLPDLIVPVPLHPARMRERGYNQSACIAKGVARVLGVPVSENAAARTRNTATQTSLDRGRRMENVSGAFRIRHPEHVRGGQILIVDDVITTGATVESLALALKQAGARGCAGAGLAIAASDML